MTPKLCIDCKLRNAVDNYTDHVVNSGSQRSTVSVRTPSDYCAECAKYRRKREWEEKYLPPFPFRPANESQILP
jgi:hypothetical protein